ncbi:hypothetical protein [Microvirga rosea]|uniref:hypothetical protein n=1 Tax=Microvirga rosea TaxID=2715425 RepID=UPI001D09EBEC|nr:hypothetical protein [Microvirga rosea]MCB8822447.1 hypothetical protein [Microvirga rosea]
MARLGAFLRGAFGIPKPDREGIERVKNLTRAARPFPPETAFAVNEIACTDPACPGIETVILVMEPGVKTRAYKISKPLDQVTEQDIAVALGF